MLHYPNFDPVAFHVGPLKVHWYGLMYLLGLGMAIVLAHKRRRYAHYAGQWSTEHIVDLVFYAALGLIVGGRIGYLVFYHIDLLAKDPWALFKLWEGGMSFHGGLIGGTVGVLLFAKRYRKSFLETTDFCVPLIPLGLAAGRLGNFINGELWGRVTTLPWGMVFPHVDSLPRHPSQLYECLLEGVLLFTLVWCYARRPRPTGQVTGLFLLGYGSVRLVAEFFRMPDAQLGFIAWNWLTMGQLLSVPMILLGAWLFYFRRTIEKN